MAGHASSTCVDGMTTLHALKSKAHPPAGPGLEVAPPGDALGAFEGSARKAFVPDSVEFLGIRTEPPSETTTRTPNIASTRATGLGEPPSVKKKPNFFSFSFLPFAAVITAVLRVGWARRLPAPAGGNCQPAERPSASCAGSDVW